MRNPNFLLLKVAAEDLQRKEPGQCFFLLALEPLRIPDNEMADSFWCSIWNGNLSRRDSFRARIWWDVNDSPSRHKGCAVS